MAAVDYFNRDPVVHTWTYRLEQGRIARSRDGVVEQGLEQGGAFSVGNTPPTTLRLKMSMMT